MAVYLGDYQSDSGFFFYRVKLEVYLVDSPTKTLRGTRINTPVKEDQNYLADWWFQRVKPLEKAAKFCEAPAKRAFLIWLSETRYLSIDCPFLPGSTDHFNFLQDTALKNKGKVLTFGFNGEELDSRRLKLHVRTS